VIPIRRSTREPVRRNWPFGRYGAEHRSSATSDRSQLLRYTEGELLPLIGGGKLAYATALGVGLVSPAAVEAALWKACETNGLTEEYDVGELERKINVYVAWSDAATNPLFNGQKGFRGLSEPDTIPSRVIGPPGLSGADIAIRSRPLE
jgi:hypothetical protein